VKAVKFGSQFFL